MTRGLQLVIFLCLVQVFPAMADSYLVTNARLYMSPSGEVVSLLIRDGRIARIGNEFEAGEDARVIDAGGGIVTPGLMNSATNLGLLELHSIKETVDHVGKTKAHAPDFDVSYGINQNSVLLDVVRSEGLARAVTLPGGDGEDPFVGAGTLLHLKTRGDIVDKAGIALVADIGGLGAGSKSRAASWSDLYHFFDKTAEHPASPKKKKHANPDILLSILEGKTPLAIMTNRESDIRQAIRFGERWEKVRIVIIGGAEAWRVAPELAKAGIPVVLNPYDILPSSYDAIGSRGDNAAILHKAGVKIAFCTYSIFKSHNAGNVMRIGAGLAVRYGLDRKAALDAMTKNPAEIWGIEAGFGTLEEGKTADLVVWSGDPLEPLSVPQQIFLDGKPFIAKSRQIQLRDKYHPLSQGNK
ncbi:amidohydrolase family protein [Emcibacter sp.]|uniref:amidohydrolase family protein n=1 Tax=Emcibacter sp. TaxID=1979954 RepID=UPI003A8F0720